MMAALDSSTWLDPERKQVLLRLTVTTEDPYDATGNSEPH